MGCWIRRISRWAEDQSTRFAKRLGIFAEVKGSRMRREMKAARVRPRVLLGVRLGMAVLAAVWGFGPTLALGASASGPVTTWAAPVLSGHGDGSVTTTDTFQQIWAATSVAQPRVGCLVLNNSTHRQWVYFGTSPTKATAIPLEPASAANAQGGGVNCVTGAGGALQDQVWITGTSGDTFVALQQ